MGMFVRNILQFAKRRCTSKLNPSKIDDIYKEASLFVDNIPKEKINNAINNLFQSTGQPNRYLEDLSELKRLAEDINCPKDIKDIILSLEKDAKTLVEKAENFVGQSKKALQEENYHFGEINESKIDVMDNYFFNKYFEELSNFNNPNPVLTELYRKIHKISQKFILGRQPLEIKISELPQSVLPKDGIVYHGTTNGRKIAKNGFSTHKSNQINIAPREFGSAVYLTPEKEVAANFAKISGRIMPIKANVEHTAFVEDVTFKELANNVADITQEAGINVMDRTPFNNAVRELIINRLFKEAGYDSVYTANGMNSGLFSRSVDDFFGRAQSQLVVFDPARLSIGRKKTLSEKIKDEILQIKSFITTQINAYKVAKEDPLSLIFMQ